MSIVGWQLWKLTCGHSRTATANAIPGEDDLYCGECMEFVKIAYPVFPANLDYGNLD